MNGDLTAETTAPRFVGALILPKPFDNPDHSILVTNDHAEQVARELGRVVGGKVFRHTHAQFEAAKTAGLRPIGWLPSIFEAWPLDARRCFVSEPYYDIYVDLRGQQDGAWWIEASRSSRLRNTSFEWGNFLLAQRPGVFELGRGIALGPWVP
jgi:hypothetical protein